MGVDLKFHFYILQIYSMVGGMANVFIWSNGVNINDELIKKNYGEPCEENFLSKVSLYDSEQTPESLSLMCLLLIKIPN